MRHLAKLFAQYILRKLRALLGRFDGQGPTVPVDPPDDMDDAELARRYYEAAGDYAQAHALRLHGSSYNPYDELESWRVYEQERIRRGYKTFPLKDFMSSEGCKVILTRLMERRGVREDAIAYAESYTASH